jgi:hypothetical protein
MNDGVVTPFPQQACAINKLKIRGLRATHMT